MIKQKKITGTFILAAMSTTIIVFTASATDIPKVLPDPDTSPVDTTKPVKVYIMSGQHNMLGMGYVNGTGPGTLETITSNGMFPYLVDNSGNWTVRNDVTYKGVIAGLSQGPLTPGFGANRSMLGTELGFGHVMGYFHDEPVIILKTSQGNRSLGWDFLPPDSERFTDGNYTYAGYGDSPNRWLTGTTPEPIGWYAGKQYDDCVGAAKDVLNNFDTHFPQYADQGYEIAGFAWWQGHKDQAEPYAGRYEENMVNFINAVRDDFNALDAPFVIATIGFEGTEMDMESPSGTVHAAQMAISDPDKYPDFAGNVKTVDTRDFWRIAEQSPTNQGYLYNRNAETFMLVGEAMGREMAQMVPEPCSLVFLGLGGLLLRKRKKIFRRLK